MKEQIDQNKIKLDELKKIDEENKKKRDQLENQLKSKEKISKKFIQTREDKLNELREKNRFMEVSLFNFVYNLIVF